MGWYRLANASSIKGEKGDTGDKGVKGETGSTGQEGDTGATGATGQGSDEEAGWKLPVDQILTTTTLPTGVSAGYRVAIVTSSVMVIRSITELLGIQNHLIHIQ